MKTLSFAVMLAFSGSAFAQVGMYDLIFPQIVSGGGISSEFVLTNLTATPEAVTIEMFNDNGPISDPVAFTLAGRGFTILRTSALVPLSSGWARVTSSGPLGGFVTISIPGSGAQAAGAFSECSCGDTQFQPSYVIPVHRDSSGVDTGLAIVQPTNQGALNNVTFTLRDSNGVQIGSGSIVMPTNGHIAKFVSELVPGAWTNLASFDGTLSIQMTSTEGSSIPFAVVAFGIGPGYFVTYPSGGLQP
jgi:hypothetical protein